MGAGPPCFAGFPLLHAASTPQAVNTANDQEFADFLITGLPSIAPVEKQVGLCCHYNL